MKVIRNKLNQRLIINLAGGKNIDLLAKGTANISEEEISSPHLQALIARGDVSVIQIPYLKESKDVKEQVQPKRKTKK